MKELWHLVSIQVVRPHTEINLTRNVDQLNLYRRGATRTQQYKPAH
jgi:hypothetical protein